MAPQKGVLNLMHDADGVYEDHGEEVDPITAALERRQAAGNAQGEQASLSKPTRPCTPKNRSLFNLWAAKDGSPVGSPRESSNSEYAVDQVRFVQDTFTSPRRKQGGSGGSPPRSSPGLPRPPLARQPSNTPTLQSGYACGADNAPLAPGPESDSEGSDAPSEEGDESTSNWDNKFDMVVGRLQSLSESKENLDVSGALLLQMADRIFDLVLDLKEGKSGKTDVQSEKLLRAVLGLMDFKDMKSIFRLARSAFELLRMEGAVRGVSTSSVHNAYLNIAKVLFKCSQKEVHDQEFLNEKLIDPLLEVLQWRQETPHTKVLDELRVLAVGVIKNISHSDENQKYLAQQGAIGVLIENAKRDGLEGSRREAQYFIQITACLRNLATSPHHHRQFLAFDGLSAMSKLLEVFTDLELLVNVSRILSKLSLHSGPCDMLMKNDHHLRQIMQCLSANVDHAPLVLRFTFVLVNLTAKTKNIAEKTRVLIVFDCDGASLLPSLLTRYWERDREVAESEPKKGSVEAAHAQELEEVLVKLVQLLGNVSISPEIGAMMTSSSAVVDTLLHILMSKTLAKSEELVLHTVSLITNLLFYDSPSNLFFHNENKQLLCRVFRSLLLDGHNPEALMETARSLGNLSRHPDARLVIRDLRLDEVIVFLLDDCEYDLAYYICGLLVNLAADPECAPRLVGQCKLVPRIAQLLDKTPSTNPDLQLCSVKVLANLALDQTVAWDATSAAMVKEVLTRLLNSNPQSNVIELARQLLTRLPSPSARQGEQTTPPQATQKIDNTTCPAPGCGRKFDTEAQLQKHVERRHPELV